MPSPFPGMNPYFEQPWLWRAFHGRFLVLLQDVITPLVVPRYTCDYEEALFLDEPTGPTSSFAVADLAFARRSRSKKTISLTAVAAPVTGTVPDILRRRHRWLTVRDTADRRVVTVIELLSPSNKQGGPDREQYLTKRRRVLNSSAHFIEIDLLRGGQRMPITDVPACDYLVMVSRRKERPRVGLWPIGLRDELPAVPIPLRGEPEPMIPLKPVLDRVYDGGGYRYKLYDHPPDPPLSAADARWAHGLIAREGD
jgi:hypothetical protein